MEILVNGASVKSLAYSPISQPGDYLTFSSVLNGRSTATFTLRDAAGAYDPQCGQSVQIYDKNGVARFGGTIEAIDKVLLDPMGGTELQITCASHEQRLDKRIVQSKVYTATTAGAVVADLIASYADGENIYLDPPSDVQPGAVIDKLIYDYDKRLSEALDELATLSNFVWYVDPDGYLFFVPRTVASAPWTLTGADIADGSLRISRSRSDLRTREWYRVNWSAFPPTVEEFTGDGAATSFALASPVNRIERITVTTAGVATEQAYGVLGVDTGKSWYWSPGSATISQDGAGTVLTAADTLTVEYRGLGDDVMMADDLAAIAARAAIEGSTGIYEHVTDDQNATDATAALARAQSYVDQYKGIALAVEFGTVRAGLRAGQVLTANVVNPPITGDWLVESVEARLDLYAGEDDFRYTIRILDGSRIGGWLQFWEKLAGSITGGGGVALTGSTYTPQPETLLPGPVTLGAAHRDWAFEDGQWYQQYTIPVTPPSPLNGFDRLSVTLQAPDDATDAATINTDDSVGFVIDDDPAEASKIANLTEPEYKAEVKWDANNPMITFKHPEPLQDEKWRVIVWSGSPHGRSASAASLVLDASPHPPGAPGEEFAPNVTAFSVAYEADTEDGYRRDAATGRRLLYLVSTWLKPDSTDPRPWLGGVVEMKRSDAENPEYWYKLTGLETDEVQSHVIEQLPGEPDTVFTFRFRSKGESGINTYVPGVTPEYALTVQPPHISAPVQNVIGRGVTYQYFGADYYGKDELHLIPDFDPPAGDPSYVCIDFWGKAPDDIWRIYGRPATGGENSAARIEHLPTADGDWLFAFVAQDVESRDANGDIDTTPPNWPAGTPTYTVHIPAPTSADAFVQRIQAAAQAANLSMTYKGAALPPLPNATLYPPGTPFMLTATTPPKFYRVSADGNSWTASVDAADVVNAHLIIAGGVVAHVIGTDELATTELLVGPPPGLTFDGSGNATSTGPQDKPTKFVVRDNNSTQTLLAFIGYDVPTGFKGLYARNVKIAAGLASTDKYFLCDGTSLTLKGATVEITSGSNSIFLRASTGEMETIGTFGKAALTGGAVDVSGAGGSYPRVQITSAGGIIVYSAGAAPVCEISVDGTVSLQGVISSGSLGQTGSVVLERITPGGTYGGLVITNGIVTGIVQPT